MLAIKNVIVLLAIGYFLGFYIRKRTVLFGTHSNLRIQPSTAQMEALQREISNRDVQLSILHSQLSRLEAKGDK